MRDYAVEGFMRGVKVLQIYEGTNEIQRNEIAEKLIKESAAARQNASIPAVSHNIDFALKGALAAFDVGMRYAEQNKLLGDERQFFRHKFADLAMRIEAAKALTERAIGLSDSRLEKIAEAYMEQTASWVEDEVHKIINGEAEQEEQKKAVIIGDLIKD